MQTGNDPLSFQLLPYQPVHQVVLGFLFMGTHWHASGIPDFQASEASISVGLKNKWHLTQAMSARAHMKTKNLLLPVFVNEHCLDLKSIFNNVII